MSSTIRHTIHSVLFATDLSVDSHVALAYAIDIAAACKAKLFIVHVLDPGAANAIDSTSSDLRKLAETAKNDLKQISESLLAAQGINGDVLVRYGSVRDLIFQAQQEFSADMVVLGSSGRKTGHGKGLGSSAEAILRSIPCVALTIGPGVVRPGAVQRPMPPGIQTVLFPTDFSATSLAALPTVISAVTSLPAHMLLLHVCQLYGSPSCLGHEAVCQEKLDKIAEFVEKQSVPVERLIRQGDIIENILSLANEKEVSFIAMGVHRGDLEDGTRLHGIVSEIIREARCPVLTKA